MHFRQDRIDETLLPQNAGVGGEIHARGHSVTEWGTNVYRIPPVPGGNSQPAGIPVLTGSATSNWGVDVTTPIASLRTVFTTILPKMLC